MHQRPLSTRQWNEFSKIPCRQVGLRVAIGPFTRKPSVIECSFEKWLECPTTWFYTISKTSCSTNADRECPCCMVLKPREKVCCQPFPTGTAIKPSILSYCELYCWRKLLYTHCFGQGTIVMSTSFWREMQYRNGTHQGAVSDADLSCYDYYWLLMAYLYSVQCLP